MGEELSKEVDKKVEKSGDTMTGYLELPGHPTRDEHAVNKAHVDRMLGYYVTVASPLVSTLIDMKFYDNRHIYKYRTDGSVRSVSDLSENSPVGHTWDQQYALVKHVDGDWVNCLRTRVNGSRGSCMFFICPQLKDVGCAVFLCTLIESFKSPSGSAWCSLFSNDDGSFDLFIGYRHKSSSTTLEIGRTYPRDTNYVVPGYVASSSSVIGKKVAICVYWGFSFSKIPVKDGGGSYENVFEANYRSVGATFCTIAANWRNSGNQYALLCNYYAFKVLQMNNIIETGLKNAFDGFVAENGM